MNSKCNLSVPLLLFQQLRSTILNTYNFLRATYFSCTYLESTATNQTATHSWYSTRGISVSRSRKMRSFNLNR